MRDQTIAASIGRGSQFRRLTALRELSRRTGGRMSFDQYHRESPVGMYRIILRNLNGDEQVLVMDGPNTDAFIVGYEAAITTLCDFDELHQLAQLTVSKPVATTEAYDHAIPAPELKAITKEPEGHVLTWTRRAGAAHYVVSLRQRAPQTSIWKNLPATTKPRITLPELTPGVRYGVRLRAISADPRDITNSPLTPNMTFTASGDSADIELTPET